MNFNFDFLISFTLDADVDVDADAVCKAPIHWSKYTTFVGIMIFIPNIDYVETYNLTKFC